MRKVTFPFVDRFADWPDNRNQFKHTKLNDAKTYWVGDYYGLLDEVAIPNYVSTVNEVTWVSATPSELFNDSYTADSALLVISAGVTVTVSATTAGPDGDFVIPVKHVQSATNTTEAGPRVAMSATKVGNNVTCLVTITTPGYYLVDNDCLNEKYPNAYNCKDFYIRVVG